MASVGSAAESPNARDGWVSLLRKCIDSDSLGSKVVFLGPSNTLGPGSLWRQLAGNELNIRRRLKDLVPGAKIQAQMIVLGQAVSCNGAAVGAWNLAPSVLLRSAVVPLSVEAGAALDRATKVEVSVESWALDQLVEGSFEDTVFKLPMTNAYRVDAFKKGRLIMVKGVRIHGLQAILTFNDDVAGDVKAQVNGALKMIGKAGADVSGAWKSAKTLTLTSKSDVYVFGEFAQITTEGVALQGGKVVFKSVDLPVGVKLGEDRSAD